MYISSQKERKQKKWLCKMEVAEILFLQGIQKTETTILINDVVLSICN